MDNVQICDNYINIRLSQTYGSYLNNFRFSVTCKEPPWPSFTFFVHTDCLAAIYTIYQNSCRKICKYQRDA
jgi:hypothetical protein